MSASQRPGITPYALVWLGTLLAWVALILFIYYRQWQSTGVEDSGLGNDIRNGVLAITALVGLAFGGHWLWKVRSAVAKDPAAMASAQATTAAAATPHGRMLAGEGERYVLEVRGLGLAVGDYYQTVWQAIREDDDAFKSVLPQDPKYYDPNTRIGDATIAASTSFGDAAKEAVERWPLPVIIIGPPKTIDDDSSMADAIAYKRQAASLGLTLFLWQEDDNTASAQATLEKLFRFFDEHPDVPEVLLVTQDGEGPRYRWKSPGMPDKRPEAPHVPLLPDSMTALLVARSDRVDRLVHPYAVDVDDGINKDDTQYDIIKLWNFFWEKRDVFDEKYEEAFKAKGVEFPDGPGVPKADWWIAQLPELWKQISNKGPGEFKPSPYLPVRWARWQVQQFDESPLLGYLHRPVHVPLTDEQGKPLKRAGQVEALRKGWAQAVSALPEDAKPTRVFYDTSLDREWVIPLTQALHGNAEGIELDDKHQGYDIGRRLGNTGVSSALVQIGLAIQAGYEDDRTSATVNLTPDGYTGIVMVSPPDAASKGINTKHRGKNPFMAHVPGWKDPQ
ncbi:type VI lipase adapter Tla3 domain-containing protein [Xanthomonas oryzae pv. oryzicola]|uniref:type VI lipase adapter Tla3 domain-containing protein n=3 Tax=Xanthomonas oryzae TaxID=347 RepID=UPI00324F38B8